MLAALEVVSKPDGTIPEATKAKTKAQRAPARKAESIKLTREAIAAMACPLSGERLVYDSVCIQLAVRLRPGSKSFMLVMWDRERQRTNKVTLGKVGVLTPDQARAMAQRKVAEVADGKDVRRRTLSDVTVGAAWAVYLQEGRPRKGTAWKPRYLLDLQRASSVGGAVKKRGSGLTKPGPLAPLMHMKLESIDRDAMHSWHAEEAKRGEVQAARALAMFSGFLSWCASHQDYRDLVDEQAASAKTHARSLPKLVRRTDALNRSDVPAWFGAVQALPNKMASAYLQALVLTGARREEMASLRWTEVDMRARSIILADKVDATRTIPLTPYLAELLERLPRLNEFVFASPSSKKGHIAEPRSPLEDALKAAELPHLTIHGLRRSYALLGEASGVPSGAIAQVMGHKPSATHEGYKPRRLEDLRQYAEKAEAFILQTAGLSKNTEISQ